MEKLTHSIIEKSKFYLDMSDGLLIRLDLFLSNTDLTQKQQEAFMNLIEEAYSEGYTNSMTD